MYLIYERPRGFVPILSIFFILSSQLFASNNGEVINTSSNKEKIFYSTLRLPEKYSHPKRYENIEHFISFLPNLEIFDGYHSYNKKSLNRLLQKAAEYELYFSPHYRSNMSTVFNMGKVGLITSFLSIFDYAQRELKDYTCLVLIENDYILHPRDVPLIEEECESLLQDKREEIIFSRFADYNYANVYNIRKLHFIHESILNTTVTRPFDHYTRVAGFFRQGPRLHRSRLLNLPSTLSKQMYATIVSWNRCMNTLMEKLQYRSKDIRTMEKENELYDSFNALEICSIQFLATKPRDNCPWKDLDPMWRPNPCT
eukprot:snap_masked-scaffold_9-processed-gene-1.28-mRNA-1 protein AED:1.00 eAED:1.00 QI:0/-1/0/0/-1/1/1/0/312